MTLQHTDERLERAAEYRRQASYLKGVARALLEVRDHVATFPAGNDPAREAMKIVRADLRDKHAKTLAEVARLEESAEFIERLVSQDILPAVAIAAPLALPSPGASQ